MIYPTTKNHREEAQHMGYGQGLRGARSPGGGGGGGPASISVTGRRSQFGSLTVFPGGLLRNTSCQIRTDLSDSLKTPSEPQFWIFSPILPAGRDINEWWELLFLSELTKKKRCTTLNCQINRTSVNQTAIFGCGSTALGAPLEISKHIQ
jgi:hypothetical protein